MDGLTEGRIVHYVMTTGEHRPAIVVKVWNKESGVVNLNVFTDWGNDMKSSDGSPLKSGDIWATSVLPDEVEKIIGTWHWIEKA